MMESKSIDKGRIHTMSEPHAYAEWLPLLDRFRGGDDAALLPMQNGSLEWTNVVAERWTRHVADTLNARLQALSKQLQTGLDRARGDYFAISNALLTARRGLVPLRAFVNLPAMPAEVRSHLASELTRWAAETQKSLERSAEGVRHDEGRLLKTIRDHPLTAVSDVPSTPAASQTSDSIVQPGRGRRIIL
jgi:hypothetical protein